MIEVHKRLLDSQKAIGKDPISILSKRIVEERMKKGLPITHAALQDYIVLDKFGTQSVDQGQNVSNIT